MKRVLFVCVHNAGRSVMAEALFNTLAHRRAEAVSAGTVPQDAPHQEVVAVLKERGIDVSDHHGRLLTQELIESADRVITMGCAVDEEACPAIRYAIVEDWELTDPKGKPLGEVRAIRNDIEARVKKLLRE